MKTFVNLHEAETYLQDFINAVSTDIFRNDLLRIERTAKGNVYIAEPEKIIPIIDDLLARRQVTGNYTIHRPQPAYPEFTAPKDMSLNFNFKMNLNLPDPEDR